MSSTIKVKKYYALKSELKFIDHEVLLYLYSEEFDDGLLESGLYLDKSSPIVLSKNPVILLETKSIEGRIVFIYKKIGTSQMHKIELGSLIGITLDFR